MSDFIYSRKKLQGNKLTNALQNIYTSNPPEVFDFHGPWGTLVVSKNIYKGYQPLETNEHIVVVIGGPLLTFAENGFIAGDSSNNKGTELIYMRWLNKKIKWDEDLDGPFCVLFIEKQTGNLFCITDIMGYIPVFVQHEMNNIMLSTHVDALAEASNQRMNIDKVSCADFILNDIVTFPYTIYEKIRQINPASIHLIGANSFHLKSDYYWLPKEDYGKYSSMKEAARDLQREMEGYINLILKNTGNIAQFLSGGEDSRVLTALLASVPGHPAFIFLDQMNREGRVAKKAAQAYGADFQMFTRSKLHYLDILPPATKLVGSGSQFIHAHTYGFHESCKLGEYDAVFGGLLSDAFLKGVHIPKIRGSKRFPFIPQIKSSRSHGQLIKNSGFKDDVLKEITRRRKEHLDFLKQLRPESAEEWFELWPATMNSHFPNFHANRRLFRSYEPFMASSIVKISASVPQKWKMNRRIFLSFAKPYLKQTKWLLHSEGRLPYFPWYINCVIQFIFWVYQEAGKRIGFIKGNQGPWADWSDLMNTPEWKKKLIEFQDGLKVLDGIITEDNILSLYNNRDLTYLQRINLLQMLYTAKENQ